MRVTLRRLLVRALSITHLAVQRLTRGRVLDRVAGMPVLLLTTTGRRSGKPRTRPLTFFRDGPAYVVVASNGGAERAPDWSLNLARNPRAVIVIGRHELRVTARPATTAERERLWPQIVATHTAYARYQERTRRTIPMLVLDPD